MREERDIGFLFIILFFSSFFVAIIFFAGFACLAIPISLCAVEKTRTISGLEKKICELNNTVVPSQIVVKNCTVMHCPETRCPVCMLDQSWESYQKNKGVYASYYNISFLNASCQISWDKRIKKESQYCRDNRKGIGQILMCLGSMVHKQLTYEYQPNDTTPVLEIGSVGDCTEYSKLFCAHARSIGVPCRVVRGETLKNLTTNETGKHHWVEVQIFSEYGSSWVLFEPVEVSEEKGEGFVFFTSLERYKKYGEEAW